MTVGEVTCMSSAISKNRMPVQCDGLLEQQIALADQGNAEALRKLGDMYSVGRCVKPDTATAIEWYEKAAQSKDGLAMMQLANLYGFGYGIKPDVMETIKWLKLAEANGQAPGMIYGRLYIEGDLVPKSMGRAYAFFLQAAERGYPVAQYTVGLEYFKGQYLYKNEQKAVQWLTRAAENGYSDAYRVLGEIYEEGQFNVAQDRSKARQWFALANAADNQSALDFNDRQITRN
jgi:TPR repeat protein